MAKKLKTRVATRRKNQERMLGKEAVACLDDAKQQVLEGDYNGAWGSAQVARDIIRDDLLGEFGTDDDEYEDEA